MSVKKITRKDGKVSWTAVIDGPRHPDGRRRQVRKTFPTKKQAESWAAKQKVSMDEGTTVVRETTTVADYLDAWLAGKRDVRDVTHNGYRDALEPVSQRYGHLLLQKLTKRHLGEMCEERLAAGRSARTVNVTMIVLGQALDPAVKERRLAYNPARLVERVKEDRKAADDPLKRAYTAQQMATFLGTADGERLAACWHLTALGLRWSEVLGLRW